jgi:hypothetical protein
MKKTNKAFWMMALLMGLVLVGGLAAQTVKYEFKPPQNNFYIKWKDYSGDIYFKGYISGGLWGGESGEQKFSTADGKHYYLDGDKWYLDDYSSPDDVKVWVSSHLTEPEMLGDYYTRFWKRYNAAVGGTLKASLYHKGKERFLGINCDIFVDNMYNRYWVDPSNGCTLKVANSSGNVGYEVLEYNLNFTRWPAGLRLNKRRKPCTENMAYFCETI